DARKRKNEQPLIAGFRFYKQSNHPATFPIIGYETAPPVAIGHTDFAAFPDGPFHEVPYWFALVPVLLSIPGKKYLKTVLFPLGLFPAGSLDHIPRYFAEEDHLQSG